MTRVSAGETMGVMKAPGPLDPHILEELRELQKTTSPTFLAELIDLFFEQAEDLMPRLRHAQQGRDLDTLVRISHTLKGTCGSVGAIRLSELCSRLNELGRAGRWDEASGQIDRVEEEYRLVRTALETEKSR